MKRAAAVPLDSDAPSAGGVWRETSCEGVKVRYQDLGPHDAPALVFIHGLGCDSTIWREQIPFFSRNYRVIALDLPGFGTSEKPHDREYSMHFFAHAVQAVVMHAGVFRPVLVGHSMGVAILRQYLLYYPGSVSAVFCVDGFFLRDPAEAKLYAYLQNIGEFIQWPLLDHDTRNELYSMEFLEYSFYDKTPEFLRRELRRAAMSIDFQVVDSCWRHLFWPQQWMPATFENLPAYVLFAQSALLPPDTREWFLTLFPDMRYHEWNDTGHYMMLEQGERFNATLLEFLKELHIG